MVLEVIRYAWGTSSLGDFVVARSEGVVALEFSSDHAATKGALYARFKKR